MRKKDGTTEVFNRQKIMHGLVTATVKRDVPTERLEALIDDIVADLRDRGVSEVTSASIGDMVMRRLIDLDKVAYVRFASVYRDFKDPEEFTAVLRGLS